MRLRRDLYIAAAGIKPSSTVRLLFPAHCLCLRDEARPLIDIARVSTAQVPICLDLGTNTQRYLDDPLYIGVRRTRPGPDEVSFLHLDDPCLLLDRSCAIDERRDRWMDSWTSSWMP